METKCPLPPRGWYCTREPGHPGPCAARPDYSVSEERRHTNRIEAELRADIAFLQRHVGRLYLGTSVLALLVLAEAITNLIDMLGRLP